MAGLQSFQVVLQDRIAASDQPWTYTIPNLPKPAATDAAGLIKCISFSSSAKKQSIQLRLRKADSSRIIRHEQLHKLLLLSFEDFKLRQDAPSQGGEVLFAPARESAEYISKVLRTGVIVNNICYHFFGHSNSQQKSRSCFMYAASKTEISAKIEALGDFSKLKSVGKKVKRIGLLFSTADVAFDLNPERCQDIPDVAREDYIFTDGCGLISKHLAKEVARRKNIVHRNLRYLPSVFQIRYRGYKGVLTLHPALHGMVQAQFRDSMRKFGDVKDHSFAVVEYSKPYSFGYLNDEIVLLMHALGISADILISKQAEHLQFLHEAYLCEPQKAFRFLCYQGETALAEKLLLAGPDSVTSACRRLVKSEYSKMLNKREEQRCRIMIPQSRLLFGVCDPLSKLKPGTCFVRVTHDGDGMARTIINTDILCTRNPTLHPGDLQKFRAVDCPELAHLVDCIVFPTCGSRPSADLMSGGDLDGDKFFVTWDPDIIPRQVAPAAAYPGVKEKIQFGTITGDDRADFFAKANNTSLGQVKNLYLKWARIRGPLSAECQQLNRLFSQCVDGNRKRIPTALEDPPEAAMGSPPFILDVLHDAAATTIQAISDQDFRRDANPYGVTELLIQRDEIAMSEFELIQLTLRACEQDGSEFAKHSSHFDYSRLTDEQRTWLLNQLPITKRTPSLIMNGLLQSEVLMPEESRKFRLDSPHLRWKAVFSSSSERMGRFLSSTARALSSFHKKLIILQPDERLVLMIYVPQKIAKADEVEVDDAVRVFALPRSSGLDSVKYRVTPTKKNYRLFCDDSTFQLYEAKRGNTFVYLTRGPIDGSPFQNAKNEREKRAQMQNAFDQGVNAECRASVALQKISSSIQSHVGRLNRAPVSNAEVYVISNRDTQSMQFLDAWLHFVDTEEVLPLFDRDPPEYRVSTLQDIDRASLPAFVAAVVIDQNTSLLRSAHSIDDIRRSMELLNDHGKKTRLLDVCNEILSTSFDSSCPFECKGILLMLVDFLPSAAFLAQAVLDSALWKQYKAEVLDSAKMVLPLLFRELVLLANSLQDFLKAPFRAILRESNEISVQQLAEIVELVALSVEQQEVALDILLECIEPEVYRLISGTEREVKLLFNNLCGVALEHVDEASGSRKFESQMVSLTFDGLSDGFNAVTASLRIDAPGAPLMTGDHVRFIATAPPKNTPWESPYAMDAIVIHSEQGAAKFRCIHPPPSYLTECTWKYKHCGSFVSGKAMIDAVTAFYGGRTASNTLYREFVGLPVSPTGTENHQKTPPDPTLNVSQNKALAAAVEHRLAFLWGPPGTGKTHTIVVILTYLLRAFPKSRFLITAPTHNAVDNILQRYLDRAEMAATCPPLRISTQLAKVAPALRKYTCDALVGKDLTADFGGRRDAQKRVKESRLIFTTCVGAALGVLRSEEFDIVLVDEASQQTEPETLIPLTKGCKRAILVGDHVQLRATVQKHAVVAGFDVSLFERVYTRASAGDGVERVMLDTQYRMHADICNFSSKEFYGGKLKSAPATNNSIVASEFPWPSQGRKVFIQCESSEDIGHQSKSNQGQVQLTQTICGLLATSAAAPASIAILTPYTRQRLLLQSALPSHTVSSIDGFQGREADVVIFVTVRSNPHHDIGFLKDMRRLNVAMTRARAGVIIVGDQRTLVNVGDEGDSESKAVWKRLLQGCMQVKIEQGGNESVDTGSGVK